MAGQICQAHTAERSNMSWSAAQAIIALLTLLVTCGPTLVIVWRFARRRRLLSVGKL